MGRITLAFPVEKIQGKVSKSDSAYFSSRFGRTYIARLINPFKGSDSITQQNNKEAFKGAIARTLKIMSEQGEAYKNYEKSWKGNPAGYVTLRGYIFAKEYQKGGAE